MIRFLTINFQGLRVRLSKVTIFWWGDKKNARSKVSEELQVSKPQSGPNHSTRHFWSQYLRTADWPIVLVAPNYCWSEKIKGVVDKVFDAAEIFNAHIRTQGFGLSSVLLLISAKIKKYYVCVLIFSQNQIQEKP